MLAYLRCEEDIADLAIPNKDLRKCLSPSFILHE